MVEQAQRKLKRPEEGSQKVKRALRKSMLKRARRKPKVSISGLYNREEKVEKVGEMYETKEAEVLAEVEGIAPSIKEQSIREEI